MNKIERKTPSLRIKMKLIIFICFILASFDSTAQETKETNQVNATNQDNIPDNCHDLFKSVGIPKFPSTFGAGQTLIRDGACTVSLSFSVLESGLPSNIQIRSIEQRCSVFRASAIRALKESEFQKPATKRACEHTYKYQFDSEDNSKKNEALTKSKNLQPFEWNQDSCSCKGMLDTSKISAETALAFINRLETQREIQFIPWNKLDEYTKEELDDELSLYNDDSTKTLNKLESMKTPEIPELVQYKKDRIFEEKLFHFLYHSELQYLITGSNKHLERDLNGMSHLATCGSYSDKLHSDQSIQNALPEFIVEQCNNNVFPENCKLRFEHEAKDLKKSRINLLMLGWHSCVNDYYRDKISPNYDATFQAVNNYISETKCDCDDTD
jgi:hypothetical protein